MSALPSKPGLRRTEPEWNSNNHQLSATARRERVVSNTIRQEGRALRNETNFQTTWDESDTRCRLRDRVWDVGRWKDELEICARKLDEEMEALTLSKEETEHALAATVVPLEAGGECLTLRDGRQGYELARDIAHKQLRKEVELLESMQQTLQQLVDKSFEHLCVLQDVRHEITADRQNKMDALDIDMTCLSLTVKSSQITLKPNPTRVPLGSSTPHEWVQFSQNNVARAKEALRVSQQMREDMSLTRAELQNELNAQHRATEFAFRKRTHSEEQAHDELEWQISKTEDEITEMEKDIFNLDADLQAKTASLKLAHTRLENRTCRFGMDLCRDEVQRGLVNEVHQLEATILALKKKLSEARHSLQKLNLHRSRMLQDLSRKQEAISLDHRSMNTRSRLAVNACIVKPPVQLVPLTNSSGRSNL